MSRRDLPNPSVMVMRRRARHRLREWPFVWIMVGVVLFVATVLLVGRMLREPIYMALPDGWVSAPLASGIEGVRTVEIGHIGLGLTGTLQPIVAARDVAVEMKDGLTLSVDTVAATVNWSALLGGDLRVSNLVVDHFNAVVPKAESRGGLSLASAGLLPGVGKWPELLRKKGFAYGEIGSLTVSSDAGELLSSVAVTFSDQGDGSYLGRVSGGGDNHPWSAEADIGTSGGEPHWRLALRGLSPAMPGEAGAALEGSADLDFDVTLDNNRDFKAVEISADIGPLVLDGAHEIMGRTHLGGLLDVARGHFSLSPSAIVYGGGHLVLSGQADHIGDLTQPWPFEIRGWGSDLVVSGRTVAGDAVISGKFDPGTATLDVSRIAAQIPGLAANAVASVNFSASSPLVSLVADTSAFNSDTLKAFWPGALAPEARSWVMGHLHSGTIDNVRFQMTAGGGVKSPENMPFPGSLDFHFARTDFRAFDGGPMVRDAEGTGRVADGKFSVALARGRMVLDDGHGVDINSGGMVATKLLEPRTMGHINLRLQGDAGSTVALVQSMPLGNVKLPAQRAEGVSGNAVTDVTITLPLIEDVKPDEMNINARINLSGVSFSDPLEGHKVEKADVQISITDSVARVKGQARIDGVLAGVDFSHDLNGRGNQTSNLHLVLKEADREKLGLDYDFLIGPMDVSIKGGGDIPAGRHKIRLDLTETKMDLHWVGLTKPKGMEAVLTFDYIDGDNGTHRIENAQIDSSRLGLGGGTVDISADGKVTGGELPHFRFQKSDRLSAKFHRAGDGVLEIQVQGARFDGRNLLASTLASGKGGDGAFSIAQRMQVNIDEFTGFGDEVLRGVVVKSDVAKGHIGSMTVSAQTGGGGSLSINVEPDSNGRRVVAEIGEAGRLMRFLNFYSRANGGQASIVGAIDDAGQLSARMDLRRMQVVNEPALARLAEQAPEGSDDMKRQTVDLGRMLMTFSFQRGVLGVSDAVMRTNTAGASFAGDVDFSRKVVRLGGTYLPATGIDNLFGWIPIIGDTLQNGGRAGLFGVTFRISGAIGDPEFSVNPLSLIAPGIFRKVFEVK